MASYKFCPVCGSNQSGSSKESSTTSKESSTASKESSTASKSSSIKSTQALKSKSLGYQKYQEMKKEKRATYFRCDKKSKKANDENMEEEVTVNVGVMKFDGLEMKAQRGKTFNIPFKVKKACTKEELMAAAYAKSRAHNKPDTKTIEHYELLYPDATVVDKLQESAEPFILHKYKKEYGKAYSRITFYLCLQSELQRYKLSLLKEVVLSSDSESEGNQHKKIKTEPTGLEPSTSKSLQTTNDEPLKIATPCDTEQIETDAALALALQMQNVDNTYASLFTVDDVSEELAANEEHVPDEEIQTSIAQQEDDHGQTCPTIEGVLTELSEQIDHSNITKFNVVRTNIFESAKRALNRKKFDPRHKTSVKFMDDIGSSEGAVDLGGPKREFFTLLLQNLLFESPLFFGNTHSRFLSLSQKSLEEEEYKFAGEIVALSLVHGGPAPRCLSSLVFQALVSGPHGVTPTVADMEGIHDITKQVILSLNDVQPEEANQFIEDNERLSTIIDLAGLWKPIRNKEDKISIIHSLIKWFLLGRNQCSLQQFQKGLEILGVLDKIKQYPSLFKSLMCYSPSTLTVECLEAKLSYERSPKGSNAFQVENVILGYWADLLQDTEDRESQLKLKDILMFAIGCFEFPPLGLKITISFLHDDQECRFPKANTCSCVLRLPVVQSTYASFKDDMTFAILNTKGFGYA